MKSEGQFTRHDHADVNDPVFVSVVEVTKEYEGGNMRRVGALVRLQPFNDCQHPPVLPQFTESVSIKRLVKAIGRITDRKRQG